MSILPYTSTNIAYDLFSIVCFPVGVYRVTSYALGTLLAGLIVPASFVTNDGSIRNFNRVCATFPDQSMLQGDKTLIPTSEGHSLESLKITYPGSNRWLVLFSGNFSLYQRSPQHLFELAYQHQINVLQTNYRGALHPEISKPSCFEDLVSDGRAVIDYLLDQGVALNDITLNGFSLGGAVALRLGREYQLPTCVHNTFSGTEAMVEPLLEMIPWEKVKETLEDFPLIPLKTELNFTQRVFYALKDLLLSPFELTMRTAYFAVYFFNDLWSGNFEAAVLDLKEVLKTIFFDTVLTFTGALALVTSPFTQVIVNWNAHLNDAMRAEHDPFPIITFVQSSLFLHCVSCLLSFTGWNINSRAEWDALRNRKLAFFAPNDQVIPYSASLANGLIEHVVRLPDDADHCNLNGFKHQEFNQFLNYAAS